VGVRVRFGGLLEGWLTGPVQFDETEGEGAFVKPHLTNDHHLLGNKWAEG